jgi:TPR repeat protein
MNMQAVFISILASIALSTGAFGQGYEEYLSKADKSYESGDKEAANALYMKAAEEGSAEAHFALAYKYRLPPKESLYHYVEAAKKGHEKALEYALDGLLFQSGGMRTADPQKALDLYLEVKKSYPAIHLAD